MLGNLSRHCIKGSNNERTYQNYSNMFENLANKKIKTICSNNRTQGIIEQHFFILKSIFFKGKRLTSLDEFVEKFHLELMTSQRLFADYALHNGNEKFHSITDKNSNESKCRVVESKFRKGKKRRFTGYYSSSLAQKRIKFIGNLPEKDEPDKMKDRLQNNVISLSPDVSDQCNSIDNFTTPLVVIAFSNLDDKNLNIMKTFSTTLWSLLPYAERNLTDYAIFFNSGYKITWLDFLTLNPAPSLNQSDAIKALYGTSGKGWLSQNVIDCYLSVIVNKANLEEGSEKFGSLSCDDFALIQRDSVRNKFTFCTSILDKNKKKLRANVFVPFLHRQHFMLLWYCKKNNCIILIDSINHDHSLLKQKMVVFQNFLKTFMDINVSNKTTFTTTSIVKQTDCNSCGVCVCIAAEMICEAAIGDNEINIKNFVSVPNISDYRYTMTYNLYRNSTKVDFLVNEIAKSSVFSQTLGLPNFGNSCWFNAVIQAIAYVLKTAKFDANSTSEFQSPNTNSGLGILLEKLLFNRPVSENLLKEAITLACNQCKFEFGTQNDPEEFYRLSELNHVLEANHVSCTVRTQTSYRCKSCDLITTNNVTEQQDIILPAKNSIDTLQEILDSHCSNVAIKKCTYCDLKISHTSRTIFKELPQVLVVCLSRVSLNNGTITKATNTVSPFQDIVIEDTLSNCRNTYKLISAVVHMGTSHDNGHYICYNVIDVRSVLMVNDKNISTETFSTIKHTVDTNGYLFFYIKTAQVLMPNPNSSDSDRDNSGKRIRYLPKKLIKKRNYVVEKGEKVKTYFILRTVPFKAKYCSTEKFGTKWEESNQTLLKFVTDHLNKVMSSSISEAKQSPNLQRHYLYLTSKNRLIKAYNCRLETELFDAQFILDNGNYVRKMFCNTEEKDFMVGDSTGKAKMCTLTLGN